MPVLTGFNKQIFDFKYKFDEAIIDYGDRSELVYVDKWADFEQSDMIQIVTKDGRVLLTHSSRVVLIGKK